jgi:TonB family protein
MSELDALANRLGLALQGAHIQAAIVTDFTGVSGDVTLQGVLLGDRLWISLLQGQRGFRILNRDVLRKQLYKGRFSGSNFVAKTEIDAAQAAGADVLITGKIEARGKELAIAVTASNVSTGDVIDQETWQVPRTESLDALALQPIEAKTPFYLTGQEGVSFPSCAYCPNPRYSDEARKRKIEGTVVLMVLIDSSGRVKDVWEIRGLPEDLTRQAMEVVRQEWLFKPARDENGRAVTIISPVDVNFRLM